MTKSKKVDKKKKQPDGFLFDGVFGEQPKWQDEWKDMPEFVQQEIRPYQSIIVHFGKEADVIEFAKIIDQKLTAQTQYIWHPKVVKGSNINKRYVDEEQATTQVAEAVKKNLNEQIEENLVTFKCNVCEHTYRYGIMSGSGVPCECGEGSLFYEKPEEKKDEIAYEDLEEVYDAEEKPLETEKSRSDGFLF